jgi:hypothetical protein
MKWSAIKQLHSLYKSGETDKSLLKSSIGKRLFEMDIISEPKKTLVFKKVGYDSIYETKYKSDYNSTFQLIEKYDLYNTNFSIDEYKALKDIVNANISDTLTLKEIASIYFKGSKSIRKDTKLHQAILNILEVDYLAEDEHDQQYLTVLHCKSKKPLRILLCENKNLLTKKRLKTTELWYAGGKNINKLKFVNIPDIPIYYLCDWDNDGIEIYYKIKQIYKQLNLIIPNKPIKYKSTKEHLEWKVDIKEGLLSNEAVELLTELTEKKKWIEEESINFEIE